MPPVSRPQAPQLEVTIPDTNNIALFLTANQQLKLQELVGHIEAKIQQLKGISRTFPLDFRLAASVVDSLHEKDKSASGIRTEGGLNSLAQRALESSIENQDARARGLQQDIWEWKWVVSDQRVELLRQIWQLDEDSDDLDKKVHTLIGSKGGWL